MNFVSFDFEAQVLFRCADIAEQFYHECDKSWSQWKLFAPRQDYRQCDPRGPRQVHNLVSVIGLICS